MSAETSPLVDSGLPSKSYGVAAMSTDTPDTGAPSVSFHNITYTITPLLSFKREPKVILSDCRYKSHDRLYICYVRLSPCSGVMHPGLNAIMGPTGSGKTS